MSVTPPSSKTLEEILPTHSSTFFYGFGGGLKVAGMADHIGVGEIDGDKVVFDKIFQNTFRYFVRRHFRR